jgi:hypothetical protein
MNDCFAGARTIKVTASSPGLASASVEIPVSADEEHSVLQAAVNSFKVEQRWE